MTAPRATNVERFVSASELGEYAYCRRAWWLRAVRGATSEEQGNRFGRGHVAHRRHAASLMWARLAAAAAILALLAAVLIWATRIR